VAEHFAPMQARDAPIVVKAFRQDNWSDLDSIITDGKSVTNWWKD
jgi:hypothetical protein